MSIFPWFRICKIRRRCWIKRFKSMKGTRVTMKIIMTSSLKNLQGLMKKTTSWKRKYNFWSRRIHQAKSLRKIVRTISRSLRFNLSKSTWNRLQISRKICKKFWLKTQRLRQNSLWMHFRAKDYKEAAPSRITSMKCKFRSWRANSARRPTRFSSFERTKKN